ncbi:hypothetical protein [Wolbachia endosymbiont (group A) of Chalcis sispes]|uniref:hypothetical protein n=1 Tax=Wolbachia endosymbiont (group A) of Chalcis sispes TaxID=3066197 RepID=UPI003132AD3C
MMKKMSPIDGFRMLLRTLDVLFTSFINPSIKRLKRLANGCYEFGAVGDIKDTLFGV